MLAQYNATGGIPKSFANVKGATHEDATGCPSGCGNFSVPPFGANIEDAYAWDTLDCYLKGNAEACHRVHTCTEPNVPVTQCFYDPGMGLDVIV